MSIGIALCVFWLIRNGIPIHETNFMMYRMEHCIRGGTYIYVPICVHTIKIHELLNKIISLKVLEVSFDTGTVLNF